MDGGLALKKIPMCRPLDHFDYQRLSLFRGPQKKSSSAAVCICSFVCPAELQEGSNL